MGAAQRRARVAAVAVLALVGAACSGADDPAHPEDPTSAADSRGTTSSGMPDPTDQARPTVEPPGPLTDREYGDDLLVVSDETLPQELLDRIAAVEVKGKPGVGAIEQFSMGQISVESKIYNVAAVDPAGFRRFTGTASAQFQEQWDRVANGEIAVLEKHSSRLPLDDAGYLAVGSGEDKHDIHVGAYSPSQVGTVDAVVNAGWGEELGLPEGNAAVISTDRIAPDAVRDKIKKFAPDLSITNLDIVAEAGIDPGTVQSVKFVGTFAQAVGTFTYTPIGGGRVAPDPAWVKEHIVTDTVPLLGRLTCNKHMMPQLKAALREVQEAGLGKEIYQTAGCYYPRFIAGSTTLSNHSFGLAIDINSLQNQRGTVGQMHPTVVAIFKRWGFTWGGDWKWTDPMHFELREIVSPG